MACARSLKDANGLSDVEVRRMFLKVQNSCFNPCANSQTSSVFILSMYTCIFTRDWSAVFGREELAGVGFWKVTVHCRGTVGALNNSPPGYGVLLKMKGAGVACLEGVGPGAGERGGAGGAAYTGTVLRSARSRMAIMFARAFRRDLRMFMFLRFRVVKRRRIGCMSWKGCSRFILSTRGAIQHDSARTFAFNL